jgi:sn-glycerol 3-phosphate transport system permease protein
VRRRAIFKNKFLPYMLLAPQLAVTLIFFFWPAGQAIYQSLFIQDAFGFRMIFVGLENFQVLLADPLYLASARVTLVFAVSVTLLAMVPALLLAVMSDHVIRGATAYRTLLIWPYAVAPAIAAVLWLFIFHPSIGSLGRGLQALGIPWDYRNNGNQALLLVIMASAWKQVSYNFIFFLAGLQSIPKAIIEASAIDGAGAVRRFFRVIFPLLSPTTFFLLIVNIIYAFFDTFGIIDALTTGGPGRATTTLIYKVYRDGYINLDLGSSSAQSVMLMAVVILITVVQFRFIERRVHY